MQHWGRCNDISLPICDNATVGIKEWAGVLEAYGCRRAWLVLLSFLCSTL